jgi:putative ABC transport system permease protein
MLWQDIRYAVRSLVMDRGVTAVVILCLALGIGINATLFSVVDGVLIQPLPFQEPDRLKVLNETFERGGLRYAGVSFQNLQDWKRQTTSFSAIGAASFRSLAVSDGTTAERYGGGAVTWDLFPMLGVPPALGRPFTADDDRPGAEPVTIISDEIWVRRYNRDPGIIGKRVSINAKPFTIVGVMPPKFAFVENWKISVPIGPTETSQPRNVFNLFVIGRLKPGVALPAATSDLSSVAARLAAEYPDTNKGRGAVARDITDQFIPDDVRLILRTMMGAVTLVLLVACANVANLMLARASGRQREFSVRAALGAGRGRVIRQLLTECVILGLASAPLGLAIAYYGVWLLDRAVPPGNVPYYIHWEISPRVIAYTAVVSALTGLVFGLAPALQTGRLNLQEALRDGARGSGQSGRRARLRNGLVIIEMALSLVLLVGASLFIRSFLNLQSASPGFDTSPLLTLRIYMPDDAYTRDQKQQRVEDILRRIEGLPGITSAFASNFVPINGGGDAGNVIIDGQTVEKGEERNIGFVGVTPHFYKTMEELRRNGFWQFRLFGYMFGIFGAAALFLAAVGVYSVLSFSVAQRTQEMGVRIALGAQQADVLRLVVRQGLTLAALGVAAGLIGAFGITRVIASLLFNVTPTDPISFGGVSAFLTVIAVIASYVPARRATRVDPIVALRIE